MEIHHQVSEELVFQANLACHCYRYEDIKGVNDQLGKSDFGGILKRVGGINFLAGEYFLTSPSYTFQGKKGKAGKSLDKLLQEFKHGNDNTFWTSISDELPQMFARVEQFKGEVCNMKEIDIQKWSKDYKDIQEGLELDRLHVLAVLFRGSELVFEKYPNEAQILCVLVSLFSPQPLIGQARTGEGKSLIVAIVAAYKALHNRKVDVFGFSAALAKRDKEDSQEFFKLFGLSCGLCCEENAAKDGIEKDDVVFGTWHSFQCNYLYDKRNGRPFDELVVDEADSLLLDELGSGTRIVGSNPGADEQHLIQALIWGATCCATVNVFSFPEGYYALKDDTLGPESDYDKIILHLIEKQYGYTFNLWGRSKVENMHQLEKLVEYQVLDPLLQDLDLYKTFKENLLRDLQDDSIGESIPMTVKRLLLELPNATNLKEIQLVQVTDDIVKTYVVEKWKMDEKSGFIRNLAVLGFSVDIYDFDNQSKASAFSNLSDAFQMELGFFKDFALKSQRFPIKLLLQNDAGGNPSLWLLDPIADIHEYFRLGVSKLIDKRLEEFGKIDKKFVQAFKVSSHQKTFVDILKPIWIKSATSAALWHQKNNQYVVSRTSMSGEGIGDEVLIVHAESTGTLSKNMRWCNGLHTFLEMKERCRLGEDRLVARSIDNLPFIEMYCGRVIGFTGTIGSTTEREILQSVHQIRSFMIPEFRPKLHYQFPSIYCSTTTEWRKTILAITETEMHFGKCALIVCATINEVGEFYNLCEPLKRKFNGMEIQTFTRDDQDSLKLQEPLTPRTLLIATALGGRGMDIPLSEEVIQNGGLHVCLTLLAVNERVEAQALGRASRQGMPGTSVIVVNGEVNLSRKRDVEDLRLKRRERERQGKQTAIRKAEEIKEKAEVSKTFSEERERLKEEKNLTESELTSINERWGHYRFECEAKDLPLTKAEVKAFMEEMSNDKCGGRLIRNPHILLLAALSTRLLNECIPLCQQAIKIIEGDDSLFGGLIYYYSAVMFLQRSAAGDREVAAEYLKKSHEHIGNRIWVLELLYWLIEEKKFNLEELQNNDGISFFSKQIVTKVTFYHKMAENIEQMSDSMASLERYTVEPIAFNDIVTKIGTSAAMLSDLASSGARGGFFELKEKKSSVFERVLMTLLGIVQIFAGILFPPICALVFSGVKDILRAFAGKAVEWGKWLLSKAIDVASSLGVAWLMNTPVVKMIIEKIKNIGVTGFQKMKEMWTKLTSFFKNNSWCQSLQGLYNNNIKTPCSKIYGTICAKLGSLREGFLRFVGKAVGGEAGQQFAVTYMAGAEVLPATTIKEKFAHCLVRKMDNFVCDPIKHALKRSVEGVVTDRIIPVLKKEIPILGKAFEVTSLIIGSAKAVEEIVKTVTEDFEQWSKEKLENAMNFYVRRTKSDIGVREDAWIEKNGDLVGNLILAVKDDIDREGSEAAAQDEWDKIKNSKSVNVALDSLEDQRCSRLIRAIIEDKAESVKNESDDPKEKLDEILSSNTMKAMISLLKKHPGCEDGADFLDALIMDVRGGIDQRRKNGASDDPMETLDKVLGSHTVEAITKKLKEHPGSENGALFLDALTKDARRSIAQRRKNGESDDPKEKLDEILSSNMMKAMISILKKHPSCKDGADFLDALIMDVRGGIDQRRKNGESDDPMETLDKVLGSHTVEAITKKLKERPGSENGALFLDALTKDVRVGIAQRRKNGESDDPKEKLDEILSSNMMKAMISILKKHPSCKDGADFLDALIMDVRGGIDQRRKNGESDDPMETLDKVLGSHTVEAITKKLKERPGSENGALLLDALTKDVRVGIAQRRKIGEPNDPKEKLIQILDSRMMGTVIDLLKENPGSENGADVFDALLKDARRAIAQLREGGESVPAEKLAQFFNSNTLNAIQRTLEKSNDSTTKGAAEFLAKARDGFTWKLVEDMFANSLDAANGEVEQRVAQVIKTWSQAKLDQYDEWYKSDGTLEKVKKFCDEVQQDSLIGERNLICDLICAVKADVTTEGKNARNEVLNSLLLNPKCSRFAALIEDARRDFAQLREDGESVPAEKLAQFFNSTRLNEIQRTLEENNNSMALGAAEFLAEAKEGLTLILAKDMFADDDLKAANIDVEQRLIEAVKTWSQKMLDLGRSQPATNERNGDKDELLLKKLMERITRDIQRNAIDRLSRRRID